MKSVGSWTRHRTREPFARRVCLVDAPGEECLERGLELEVRGRLVHELSGPEGQVLPGPALRIARQLEDAAQVHERSLVVGRLRVDLGPERYRLRELPSHVLDLREEVQRGEVFGVRVEHLGDFALGVVELARLYEELRVLHPSVDGLKHEASD